MADDRSNRRHLATMLDMWSNAVKSTIVVKRVWLDLECRGRDEFVEQIINVYDTDWNMSEDYVTAHINGNLVFGPK